MTKAHNNHMHSDSKKRRSFLALLFAAGDVRRYACMYNKNMSRIILSSVILLVFTWGNVAYGIDIKMSEVRALAKLPVEKILTNSPIEEITTEEYWNKVHGRSKPLVVFFYSNIEAPSQRLATLIKYIAPEYTSKLDFARVKVLENGKPDKNTAKELAALYSLDDTPGILFYDNVGKDMVLEDEDYIDADFKEFRTPSMFLWKTYYRAVRKELDKLLAD